MGKVKTVHELWVHIAAEHRGSRDMTRHMTEAAIYYWTHDIPKSKWETRQSVRNTIVLKNPIMDHPSRTNGMREIAISNPFMEAHDIGATVATCETTSHCVATARH